MQAVNLLLQFVLLALAQNFLFSNLTLAHLAFANAAIVFPVFFPMNIRKIAGLVVVFLFGLTLDLLRGAYGFHAFSMVFVYFMRTLWIDVVSPMARVEGEENLDIRAEIESSGFLVSYLVPLVFLYQLVYFLMTDFDITGSFFLKVLCSGVYSSIICLLIALLVYRKGRGR